MQSLPLYQIYEMQHAALSPFRAAADAARLFFQNPVNPFAHTLWGKSMAAGAEMFERVTRRYGKPEWVLDDTIIDDEGCRFTPARSGRSRSATSRISAASPASRAATIRAC